MLPSLKEAVALCPRPAATIGFGSDGVPTRRRRRVKIAKRKKKYWPTKQALRLRNRRKNKAAVWHVWGPAHRGRIGTLHTSANLELGKRARLVQADLQRNTLRLRRTHKPCNGWGMFAVVCAKSGDETRRMCTESRGLALRRH